MVRWHIAQSIKGKSDLCPSRPTEGAARKHMMPHDIAAGRRI